MVTNIKNGILLLFIILIIAVVFFVPPVLISKGDKALALKNGEVADKYFSYAQKLNPWRKDLYLKRGKAQYWQGNFLQALKFLEQAGPPKAGQEEEYWSLVGSINLAAGNYEQALKAYEKVISLEPAIADLINPELDYNQFPQLYEKIADLDPRKAFFLNSLGAVYIGRGQTHIGKFFVKAAIVKARQSGNSIIEAKAYNNLGLALAREGNYQIAEGFIKRALELLPDEPAFYDSLGEVYEGLGKINEAISAYEKALALALNSKDPVARKNIQRINNKLTYLKSRLK